MRVLEQFPIIKSPLGLIYLSRLSPGTVVAPHRGPTNMRLRCHLAVKVPDGCGISVDNEVGSWREGRCIVFDDSFVHAAWNSSSDERIVVVLDIWHPDLTFGEVELIEGLQKYATLLGARLNRYWVKNEDAREKNDDEHQPAAEPIGSASNGPRISSNWARA
jgi:hypothetical protein